MPWQVYREDKKFCVHKKNADGSKGEKVACHDTEEKALAQMRALYVHAHAKVNLLSSPLFLNQHRVASRDGREHWVVPGVPARAQVMNDYLVPADEIGSFVQAWNGTPLTIHHPKNNSGSANVPDPDVSIIGRFYNADWDGQRMTGEYWIDVEEARKHSEGRQILANIEAGKIIETSTGYYAEDDMTPGVFEGRAYNFIHRNIRPDHISILPNEIGACSVKDGCGVNRNESKTIEYVKDHLPAAMLYGYSFNKGSRTQEQLDGLRAHIQDKGIDKPVTIMRTEEGQIKIIDGNHRVSMGHEMGIEQIPVKAYNHDLQEIDPEILYKEWMHSRDQLYLQQKEMCTACDCPYKNPDKSIRDYSQAKPAGATAGDLERNPKKESHMNMEDVIKFFQGKGWKVTANAAGDYSVEEPAMTEEEKKKKEEEEAAATQNEGLTANEISALKQMAAMLPALQQAMQATQNIGEAVQVAKQIKANQENERNTLIASIKASQANPYSDDELNSLGLPILVKLNAQLNVSYAGIDGGAQIFQNVADPLTVKAVLSAPYQSQES